MTRIRLYIDEDAMDSELVGGLRARGIDVVTAADAQMIRRNDEDHLAFAAAEGRSLYSFNISDFHQIHTASMATGREHCGIILARQRRYSVGEQLRRLARLTGSVTRAAMQNREEFLTRW